MLWGTDFDCIGATSLDHLILFFQNSRLVYLFTDAFGINMLDANVRFAPSPTPTFGTRSWIETSNETELSRVT